MYLTKCCDVEADGRGIINAKDPPGQRCIYIRPGSPERESYRLLTYEQFPRHVPINTRQLASCGFYYTGFKDRVKCFSCGDCVDEWCTGDIANDPRWHSTNCEFVNGTDTRNIPMLLLRSHRNSSRFATNLSRPAQGSSTPPINAGELLMNLQTNNNSNAEQAILDGQRNVLPIPNPAFPCNNPVNPHMENQASRLQTFSYGNQWPAHTIRSTPEEMAAAGLFYLGNRDKVKCWYCNGGLQNWDTDDDPWFEHAKWYPECEFLLKCKGVEFVDNVSANFPSLSRPANQNSSQTDNSSTSQSQRPNIIDPQERLRTTTRVVTEAMQNSTLVTAAETIGFNGNQIKMTLTKQYQNHGRLFKDVTSLVNALLETENSDPSNEIDTTAGSQPSTSVSISGSIDLSGTIQNLEVRKLCKVCNNQKANIVFLPCGHLASCLVCSGTIQNCPVCRTKITEIINCFPV